MQRAWPHRVFTLLLNTTKTRSGTTKAAATLWFNARSSRSQPARRGQVVCKRSCTHMYAMEPRCTRSLPRRGVRISFACCSSWGRTPTYLLLLLLLRWWAPVMRTTTGSTRRNSPSTRHYLVRPWQGTLSVCRSWSTKLESRSMSPMPVVELPPCSILWRKGMSKSSNSYCQEAPQS
jgi:hypothetical protein